MDGFTHTEVPRFENAEPSASCAVLDSVSDARRSQLDESPPVALGAEPVDFGALLVAQVSQPVVPSATHNAIGDELIARSVPPENYHMQRKEREPYDEVKHKYALIQEIILRGSFAKACTALNVDYAGAYRDMKRDEGGFYDWDLIADEYRKQYLAADSRIFMRRIRKAVDQTMHHVDRALGAKEYDFKSGVWSEVERMVKTVRLLQDKSTENVDLRAALSAAVDEFKRKPDDERRAILEDLRRGVPVV